MPKLSIVAHSCHKGIAIGFVSDGILVAIAIIIINETGHSNQEMLTRDGVVLCAVGEFIESVEVYTAVEVPNWGGMIGFPDPYQRLGSHRCSDSSPIKFPSLF